MFALVFLAIAVSVWMMSSEIKQIKKNERLKTDSILILTKVVKESLGRELNRLQKSEISKNEIQPK